MPITQLKTKKVLIAKSENLAGRDFEGKNFDGANFRKVDLQGVSFTNCSLRGARFWEADLEGAEFENCDLQRATFKQADLHNASFRSSLLSGATFDEYCVFNDITFERSVLKNAVIGCDDISTLSMIWCLADGLGMGTEGGTLENCSFERCTLTSARFAGTFTSSTQDETFVSFESCVFDEADFSLCDFKSCRIQNCEADGVKFGEEERYVINLHVTNSILTGANFNYCAFTSCGFFNSDLSGSSFEEATLDEVTFRETGLGDCNFYGVEERNCNGLIVKDETDCTFVGWILDGTAHVNLCEGHNTDTLTSEDFQSDWVVSSFADELQAQHEAKRNAILRPIAQDVLEDTAAFLMKTRE